MDEITQAEFDIEEECLSENMTSKEIWIAGFKFGLSKAGILENADDAFKEYLSTRIR